MESVYTHRCSQVSKPFGNADVDLSLHGLKEHPKASVDYLRLAGYACGLCKNF